jgi:hypothetical protein
MHPIIDNLILGPLKYLKKIIINQIKIKRRKRIKEEKKQLGVELRRNIEKKKARIG